MRVADKRKKIKAVLLYTYIISSIPLAVSSIIYYCIKPIKAFNRGVGLTSIFHQFNHYGYFLLIAILISSVLFIKEKNIAAKAFCLISFILNNVTLIMNDTFDCYLACFIGLIFVVIVISVCDKKINTLSIAVFGLLILISLIMSIWFDTIFTNIITFITDIEKVSTSNESSDSAGTGRWRLWTHTAKYILEKPILGFGVEGINERLNTETHGINTRPHCEFLQYAAFFGIPSAISYLCGIMSVYFNALKKRYELDIYTITALAAAFGYVVSSLFGNTMYYTAPYFFILLGMGFGIDSSKNNE